MDRIRNQDLNINDIPEDVSDWHKVLKFGLTINGYDVAGSVEKCIEIGKAQLDNTLTNLRICLFYECRRDYWTGGFGPDGYGPDEETAVYINQLLKKIRNKVESCDFY